MKTIRLVSIIFIISALFLSGCSASKETSVTEDASLKAYEEVMAAEEMNLQDAYEKLKDLSFADQEKSNFVEQLKQLNDCSGGFVQVSEDTGNRYAADVSFYLTSGEINCSIEYSGYMGTIRDGKVTKTKEDEYLFETSTIGDLFTRQQDFHIYFSPDLLKIAWAESSEYVLTRGDGSIESVQDYRVPFEESEAYQSLTSIIDKRFDSYPHELVYDKDKMTLDLFVELPEGSRQALATKDAKLLESWNTLADSLSELSNSMLTVVRVGKHADYVNIYFVDKLRNNNSYLDSDFLLWIQNGEVKYDYQNDLPSMSSSSGNSSSYGNGSSSDSSSQSGSSATSKTFEDSKSYKEIRSNCLSNFSDNDPKLNYDASKNILTLTLVAPKGTQDGVDDLNMGVTVAWYDWTASLSNVSWGGYKMMSDEGYGHIAFIIMVLSDKDQSKALYATMNGEDYYNFAGE